MPMGSFKTERFLNFLSHRYDWVSLYVPVHKSGTNLFQEHTERYLISIKCWNIFMHHFCVASSTQFLESSKQVKCYIFPLNHYISICTKRFFHSPLTCKPAEHMQLRLWFVHSSAQWMSECSHCSCGKSTWCRVGLLAAGRCLDIFLVRRACLPPQGGDWTNTLIGTHIWREKSEC